MKKMICRLFVLTLCSIFLTCPMSISAEEEMNEQEYTLTPEGEKITPDGFIISEEKEWRIRRTTPLKVETEKFSYDSEINEDRYSATDGIILSTDATDANYMVTGVFHYEESGMKFYTLLLINEEISYRLYANGAELDRCLDNRPLEAGDLLKLPEFIDVIEDIPPELSLVEVQSAEYIGYGTDVLGKEFADVILNELYIAPNYIYIQYDNYELPENSDTFIKKGDVTNTGTVSILDVITTNKAILGVEKLDVRSSLAADVDCNGKIEATDSLNIMKHIVGLESTLDA